MTAFAWIRCYFLQCCKKKKKTRLQTPNWVYCRLHYGRFLL